MKVGILAVVEQRHKPERLRKVPLYGKGSVSWTCGVGKHRQCSKLTCSCKCHGEQL